MYKDLIIKDDYINGEIFDIINYLLKETQQEIVNNFLNENIEELSSNLITIGDIVKDLYNYSFKIRYDERITIKMNPMGSWYIEKEN